MEPATEISKMNPSCQTLLRQYQQKYCVDVEASLNRNNHMNEYDGEPCTEASVPVTAALIDSTDYPTTFNKIMVGDLLTILKDSAKLVRHVKFDLKQTTIDAILVDFINYIGVKNGVDYALYTKDLFSKLRVTDAEPKTVAAENFCGTLHVNVDNSKLTDTEFRQFVRNTLPIVKYPRHE